MAQLELPAPVLTSIVSKILDCHSSESWKTLRLVCKSLCARTSSFAQQLRLEVDDNLPHKARRCMERGFRAETLYLVNPASAVAHPAQPADQTTVLLSLFRLPIWAQIRTLRLRGVDLPEKVLSLLPQACPNLQELFLEGVVQDSNTNNSTSCCSTDSSGEHSSRTQEHLQPQQQQPLVTEVLASLLPVQELPTVAVGSPCQVDGQAYEVQLCSVSLRNITQYVEKPWHKHSSHSTRGDDRIITARLARILSQFRRLRLLRMDCSLAEGVMRSLCSIHQRPCLQDKRGSMGAFLGGRACTPEQPLLEYIPLLGWYLFNVIGPPCPAKSSSSSSSGPSSGISRNNSVSSCSHNEQQPFAAAIAACENGGSTQGDWSGCGSDADISSSSSSASAAPSNNGFVVGINGSSSCPPSANNSSNQLAPITDTAIAADATLSCQAIQMQQLQGDQTAYDDKIPPPCAFAASLSRSSSIGRHSLDVSQQQHSKGSGACNNAPAAPHASNACNCIESSAASCCSSGQAHASADDDVCTGGRCSCSSTECVEDVCSTAVIACSTSASPPCKAYQGKVDQDVRGADALEAMNNAVCTAAGSDTMGVCSDQVG